MNFLVSFMSFLFFSFGAPSDVNYSEIESAFLKKSPESITRLGNDKMMISLFGKENIYSNQQATLVLKDFFSKHTLTDFKFIFKGKETQDGSFAIGKYESKSESFRFTFHFKKADNTYKIIRMNIENE